MHAESYQRCQACGHTLEHPTVYRNHAYCDQCQPSLGGTSV